MAQPTFRYAMLLDLAKATSSEQRRELLMQVTDAFLSQPGARSNQESKLFDEVFGIIAGDLELQVRAELAHRIAASSAPVGPTARRLAMDAIEVARPIIQKSPALTEQDMLDVIGEKGPDHQIAVARRPQISEAVSSALVAQGNDTITHALLENATAQVGRETFERIAKRAEANSRLHAPFVKNRHVPLDLLNDIYLQVGDRLRQEILTRFHGVSEAELNAALEISRKRLWAAYGALPADYESAEKYVTALARGGAVKPSVLVELLREGRKTAFLILFSREVETEFGFAAQLVSTRDIDALAMLCRCAGFDRALFVTLCILIGGEDYAMSKAEAFGQLYERVPVAAAERAVRFWKVRTKLSRSTAAA